jgi:hypothetical protein
VEVRPGGLGQFDILADGERIAGKPAGVRGRLLGPFPRPEDVIERLREAASGAVRAGQGGDAAGPSAAAPAARAPRR